MPFSSAAAAVKALKVEPAWYPWMPPISGSTARFQKVSPFLLSLPISGRLCAIATIRPVPGWIMFMVAITGSFGPTTRATDSSACRWVLGSIAVWMVSPPRLIVASRSSRV